DLNPEGNRTFFVNLTSPSNGSIVRAQGLATIIDDDGTGVKVSVGDVSQFEGNVGTSNFVFPVFLSERSAQDFKVAFTTVDGTARGGVDYFATSGILTIPAGALTSTITVPVIGNMISQPNRSFSINLSNQNQGTIARAVGTGTIIDDDGLTLSVTDVTVPEPGSGTANAVFTVTLSHATTVPVTFTYATADG